MSQVAAKQLNLIIALAGGQVTPRAMLPSSAGSTYARLLQLGASVCGFLGSRIWPSMAILGKQLAWGGSGIATVMPNLTATAFLREFIQGRPVIFVRGLNGSPYAALSQILRFDPSEHLNVLLNGNSWLAIAGCRGGEKVFAHVGAGERGHHALMRHEIGLSNARAALMETSLLRAMAAPISAHQEREISVFAQTYLEGTQIDGSQLSCDDFLARLMSAGKPLIDIHKKTFSLELPERALLNRMRTDLPTIGIDPSLVACIERIIGEIQCWLENRRLGAVQVHGDYTLSNILFDNQGEVCALLDWEWTRQLGCVGFDAVYLGIAATADKFGVPQSTLATNLIRSRDTPSVMSTYFSAMMPQLDLGTEDLVHLAKLVWLTIIFRSAVWTSPTYEDWLPKTVAAML